MKQVWKKRAVVVSVLLLVCAAVYLNWRYTGGVADTSKVLGQSTLVSGTQEGEDAQQTGTDGAETPAENDYFATARLSRKQARDSAISMLKEAEVDENAEQTVLNEASETLQVLAAYTVAESQIESLVTAKGYADCVAFMGEDSISVVVSAPEGLQAADVARIKDIVIQETDYTAPQIKIIQNADQTIVDKIDTTISTTIPVWKSQMVIALGLSNQRKVLDLQNKADDVTNKLLARNAAALHKGAVDAEKANQRSVVEIDTLEKINAELIATLKETVQIQKEGEANREAAQVKMRQIESDLKNALLENAQQM